MIAHSLPATRRGGEPSPGGSYHYCDIPQDKLPTEFPDELNRFLIHGYHAAVSYVDANVGRVLEAFRRNGLAANTIVILWSDHGRKLEDHSSWTKQTNLEIDTRVPLIIRMPGCKPIAGSSDVLMELIDLFPTICDLVRIPKPAHLQGRSFYPVFVAGEQKGRLSTYSSFPARIGGEEVTGHSIRTENYRYTEWWDGADKVVASVGSDLAMDPGETTAITRTSESADLSGQLGEKVERARTAPAGSPGLRR